MPEQPQEPPSQRAPVAPLVVLIALAVAVALVNPMVAAYGVVAVAALLLQIWLSSLSRRQRHREAGALAPPPILSARATWLPMALLSAAAFVLAWFRGPYVGAAIVAALLWPIVTSILRATWFSQYVRVTVGADGMFVRRRGAEGFVPWSDVADMWLESWDKSRSGRGFYVKKKGDGDPVRLGAVVGSEQEARDLVRHARRQRAQYDVLEGVRAAGALDLARDGRDTGAWLEGVRALRLEHPDYRAAGVDDEILWSVVEAPRAEPTARAGAAAALAPKLGDGDRARLRVAAGSSALPELRTALEDIAAADAEGEVERALGKMRG